MTLRALNNRHQMSLDCLEKTMGRLVHALLVSVGALGCGQAVADDSQWQVRTSDQHTYIASIANNFQGAKGTILGILTIETDPAKACSRGLELALLHGSGYGNPLGKISPANTTPLCLEVDGRVIPVGDPYWIKYDNGYSAIAPVGDDVVAAMEGGQTARVMLTPGTAKLEFAIIGADRALDAVDARCRSAMATAGSR